MASWFERIGQKQTDYQKELDKLRQKYEKEVQPPFERPIFQNEKFESLFPELRQVDKTQVFQPYGATEAVTPTTRLAPEAMERARFDISKITARLREEEIKPLPRGQAPPVSDTEEYRKYLLSLGYGQTLPEPKLGSYENFERNVIEWATESPPGQVLTLASIIGTFAITGFQGAQVIWNTAANAAMVRNLTRITQQNKIPLSKEEIQVMARQVRNLAEQAGMKFKLDRYSFGRLFKPYQGRYVATPEAAREAEKAAEEAVTRFAPQVIPRGTQTGAMAFGGLPAKQPWQMTNQEYITSVIAKGNPNATSEEIKRIVSNVPQQLVETEHKSIIQQALSEDKPVPPEVLKDYPDLVPPKPETTIPSAGVGEPEAGLQPSMIPEEVSEKQPYQMTSAGFENTYPQLSKLGLANQRKIYDIMVEANVEVGIPVEEAMTFKEFQKEFAATRFDVETGDIYPYTHEEMVKQALQFHQEIPESVKAEYPKMIQEYEAKRAKQQALREKRIAKREGVATTSPQPPQAITKPVEKAVTPEVPLPTTPKEIVISPTEGEITAPLAEPPDMGPPKTPVEEAIMEGVPSEWEGLMPNLRSVEDIKDIIFVPNRWRQIANLPIMKQIMSHLNPAAVADSPQLEYKIIRSVFRFESAQRTSAVMSHLNRLGSQEKVFGKLNDKGLIASGKLKGLALNDIRTNPKMYAGKLTREQMDWIVAAEEIEKAKLDFLQRNGIDIKELSFSDGGKYAGRRWLFKINTDGTVVESASVGAGPGRPGKKLGAEKHRTFATQAEGIKAGFFPLPEDEALYLNVQGAYNRVADVKAADWLLTQVEWRTTGAPEELVLAAEGANLKLRRSQQLLAALNRATRGERVPDSTVNSIARAYPEEAGRLTDLIAKVQAKQPATTVIKALRQSAKDLIKAAQTERWKAVTARARAREQAMQVGFEEGMISAPAFAGKIFTGPEAKEITRAINTDLLAASPEVARAVNKVNAVSRYFMLAGDFSPLMIQLLYLAGANPKVYAQAGVGALKGMFNPQFISNYYANNRELLNDNPDLILSRGGSTEFTEAMRKGGLLSSKMRLLPQEESFLKNVGLFTPRLIGKTGATILEPFQRFFETSLDVAGIEMRKALDHMVTDSQSREQVNMFINEFRGVASSERIGVSPNWRETETAVLLAPRYNRAIAGLLFDLGRGNIRGDLARKHLARGVIAVVIMGLAISIAKGEDDPLRHLNPSDPDFMTWDVAGQRVGPGTKLRSVIRLFGRWSRAIQDGNAGDLFSLSMRNPNLAFVRGNLSPAVGAAVDILTGENYIGDPTRDGLLSFTKEIIVGNMMPIWVENVLMEGGTVGERAIRGLSEIMGGRAYPASLWDKIRLARKQNADALDEYGEIPSNPDELKAALRDGTAQYSREQYRELKPEVDAILFITGQVSTVKTPQASQEVLKLVEENKIAPSDIRAVKTWQKAEDKRKELGLRDTNITLTDRLIQSLLGTEAPQLDIQAKLDEIRQKYKPPETTDMQKELEAIHQKYRQ